MADPLRVLIVEDSEDDALLLLRELRRAGFEPSHERVDTEATLLTALGEGPWDLVLSDFAMGGFNGLAAFELVKRSGIDVPFIFVSGHIGEERAADAMRRGASDYVLKGNLTRLIPAIQRELEDAEVRRQRQQMERDLQEREFQLSSIYDTVADVIFQLAVEGEGRYRFVSVNRTFSTVTGLDAGQVVGRLVDEVLPEASLGMVLEKYGEAIREKRTVRWEETSEYPTGQVSGEVSIAPIFDEAGACTHLVGAVHDITARKQAEERFAAIIENSQDVITVLDEQARFTLVSPSVQACLGYTPADLLGQSPFALIHPEDLQPVQQQLAKVAATPGAVGRNEFRLRHQDGSWRQFEVVGKNLGDNPAIRGVLGTLRDITERKRAEEERQLLSSAIAQAADSITITDPDGVIQYVNPAYERTTGFTREEVLGEKPSIVKSGRHPQSFYQELWETITRGEVWSNEMINRKKDGTLYTEIVTISPVQDSTGRIVNFIGVKQDITARKQAEERLSAIMANVLDVILVVDGAAVIRLINPAVKEQLDYTPAEMEGQSVLEFIHPEDHGQVERAQGSVLAAPGNTASVEFRFRHRDGSWRYYEGIGKNLLDDPGVAGVLVNARDITARKESEERYRRLVEGSLQGIAIVQDRQVVFCNQAFVGMLGYGAPAEVVGMPFIELVAPQERERIQQYHEARLAGGEVPSRYEYLAQRKDGSLAWIEREAHLMEWDGRPAVQTSNIDVTERKQAEQRFSAIFENSQDVVAVVNAESRFTLVSPSVTERLGLAPEALLGQSVFDFIHPDDHPRVREKLAAVFQHPGAEAIEEVRFRHQDGSWRDFEAVGKNLLDNPAVAGVLGMLREITDRKELQSQLIQSQKMEAVGSLAGGVAHDFNNLLSVILSYSGFLLERFDENDPAHADALEIQAAGNRASALTRQLLAFSRRQVLKLEMLDLNEILRNMERMLTRLIREDIVLLFELDKKLGAVRADSGQVEQIVMNLVVNARDAMPDGGRVTIETNDVALDEEYVSHHLGASPGDYVMLAVSDTGSGMSEEVRLRIFEPFFTTKEAGKGTGLGLATVYGIVKQLSGSIWVYSELGQGTTFKVYLPRYVGSDTQRPAAQAAAAGGNETILVTEDEPSVRSAACRILRSQGYTVLEAGNGEEAMKVLVEVEGRIDLLLTDVVMPVMGGHHLRDRLEMLSPGAPTLFMSGYTSEGIVNHGVLEEGVEFLQKPFTRQSLLLAVRTALDGAKKK